MTCRHCGGALTTLQDCFAVHGNLDASSILQVEPEARQRAVEPSAGQREAAEAGLASEPLQVAAQ